jgi:hypothetical protein
MILESILERIAISAERSELLLAKVLGALENTQNEPAPRQEVPAPVPTVPVEAPPPPPPAAPVEMTIPMPAAAPAAPTVTAPFTDAKGLLAYCMAKYKELGPDRGAGIQKVLMDLGHNHLNGLTPDQYGAFFAKVESL